MSALTQRYFCPVTATSKLIGKKWQPVIIERLMSGPKRFGEIRALIPGLSAKVLSDSLEQLEKVGIVRRTVEAKRPVKIHYSLTERGADLEGIIESMKAWGDRWLHPRDATRGPSTEDSIVHRQVGRLEDLTGNLSQNARAKKVKGSLSRSREDRD